ncbi:hypothetical protein GCM10010211_42340 [Streptomyces albospinus]|uniref:Uncharacterized protein n=1 Tax=Streptomyces albospinus TaxID=285515 RepID=A0ABQ2V947_9ACTN|nr:hypothetical protein GCM10010211_42340 [Streptomyces albospinus]
MERTRSRASTSIAERYAAIRRDTPRYAAERRGAGPNDAVRRQSDSFGGGALPYGSTMRYRGGSMPYAAGAFP